MLCVRARSSDRNYWTFATGSAFKLRVFDGLSVAATKIAASNRASAWWHRALSSALLPWCLGLLHYTKASNSMMRGGSIVFWSGILLAKHLRRTSKQINWCLDSINQRFRGRPIESTEPSVRKVAWRISWKFKSFGTVWSCIQFIGQLILRWRDPPVVSQSDRHQQNLQYANDFGKMVGLPDKKYTTQELIAESIRIAMLILKNSKG